MEKFYKIHSDLGLWDPLKIEEAMRVAMRLARFQFDHWKKTIEIQRIDRSPVDAKFHWNPDAINPTKITNGDMNITTNTDIWSEVDEHLFCGSGRRGNLPKNKAINIENCSTPKITDDMLAQLAPVFRGTILEDLHKSMENKFGVPIRIRCQNRPVGSNTGAGLYWHKDNPVENRYHIPVWTNQGHILLFSEKNFKWEAGFDKEEAKEPMDVVGHYVPADGRVYEFFTKDYMHAVASVGVGWYQDRGLQTRCHLSFWKALV